MYAEIVSPTHCINATYSLNRDLLKIQLWCLTWRMKLNPRKIHSITIILSRALHHPLTLCGLDLEISSSPKLLEVTLDVKLTFEKHIRNLVSFIIWKTVLIRKYYKTLGNKDAVFKFYALILLCFELCPTV